MKRLLLFVSVLLAAASIPVLPVGAESLSLSPLEYKETLKPGDKKKGYIDIVNPEPSPVTVRFAVRRFEQVNDTGGIDFFEDEKLARGILLDLEEIDLGPHEGARVYFLIDSNTLPTGDVFAAIMARSIVRSSTAGTSPTVEVGTLMMLTNGKAPEHHAAIKSIDAPWLQVGNTLEAAFTVANKDSPKGEAIGFSPSILVEAWPYGSKKVDGPLLFAGRSRVVSYEQPGNYVGPIRLTVTATGQSETRWLFAVTGYWRVVLPLALGLIAGIVIAIRYLRRGHRNRG